MCVCVCVCVCVLGVLSVCVCVCARARACITNPIRLNVLADRVYLLQNEAKDTFNEVRKSECGRRASRKGTKTKDKKLEKRDECVGVAESSAYA